MDDLFIKDAPKFKAAVDAYQAELQKLSGLLRERDRAAVGVAVRNVRMSCSSCHENFSTIGWRLRVQ